MRIIAGIAKGREILRPKTQFTRPVMDSTREAIFNILGPIDGLQIADLYAGSGALGLEALSRGAGGAVGVETAGQSTKIIEKNVSNLGFTDYYQLEKISVERWLTQPAENFDIIFIHPPYTEFDASLVPRIGNKVKSGGLLIIILSKRQNLGVISGLKLLCQLANPTSHHPYRLFYRIHCRKNQPILWAELSQSLPN